MTHTVVLLIAGLAGLLLVVSIAQRLLKLALGALVLGFVCLVAYYWVLDNAPDDVAASVERAGTQLGEMSSKAADAAKKAGKKALDETAPHAKKAAQKIGKGVGKAADQAAKAVGTEVRAAADKAAEAVRDEVTGGSTPPPAEQPKVIEVPEGAR